MLAPADLQPRLQSNFSPSSYSKKMYSGNNQRFRQVFILMVLVAFFYIIHVTLSLQHLTLDYFLCLTHFRPKFTLYTTYKH